MEKEFKIQGNQVTITIPDGMTIDKENSTFECIKFKHINKSKFSDYDGSYHIEGWRIAGDCTTVYHITHYNNIHKKDVFATEKQAKSALAMAQISQIMANDERFGGVITDKEWLSLDIRKYCIVRTERQHGGSTYCYEDYFTYFRFLAFHTEKQRDLFLQENEQLVKDYLMID